MQIAYDLLTILSALLLAAVLLIVPLSIVEGVCKRIQMKRALRELGYTDIKVQKNPSSYGHQLSYLDNGVRKSTVIRSAYGDHFQLCDGEYEPTHFVFCNKDGTVDLVELPSPTLIGGTVPYYCRRFNNGIGMCLTWAVFVVIAAPCLAWWPFSRGFLRWSKSLQPTISGNVIMEKLGVILLIAVALLCFVYFPLAVAVWTYRRLRYEEIISPFPICQACTYDLRGNESQVCPECGEELSAVDSVGDDSIAGKGPVL